MITIDGGTGKVLHNGVDIASRIMIDQWRRNAVLSLSSGENFITTDWERVDGSGQGACIPGGGMSESGGIFTFPIEFANPPHIKMLTKLPTQINKSDLLTILLHS